jgi:putative tricarboxylic transport membrane protein
LNLPLIGIWVWLLKVPYRLLFPAIMAFSAIGVYSLNQSAFEIYLAAAFGVVGFVLVKLDFSLPPMLLGFVLGPMLEDNLRRSMVMGRGDPSIFLTRPISLCFIIAAILILILAALPVIRKRRQEIAG